jgi:hypothetical protein
MYMLLKSFVLVSISSPILSSRYIHNIRTIFFAYFLVFNNTFNNSDYIALNRMISK